MKKPGRYQAFLEANPDPIVIYDMEGKVIYLNNAFTRVFGWSLEALYGKRIEAFVPDENWPETRIMIDNILAGKDFPGI